MGMFVASILLCCFASVIESGRVNFPVPPMPESFPCLKGRKCPAPWPICPNPRPRCGIAKGRCCQPEVVTHRRCPKGSLTGRLCNRLKPCPYGYTCKRGRCCSNQCPKGVLQGSFCDRKRQCKRGYKCTKGVCCRRKIIIAANPCFLPKKPGRCKAYGPSWFYNPMSSQCEKFIYGGCGGNGNRFSTLKECQNACTGFCPGGARPFKGMPPNCALSKRPFPAGCTSDKQCPKGKKCCPTYCGGFCPGGARPFKGMPPKCALSKRPFPAGCTSDKQCPNGKKCCPTYCGGRRCVTALFKKPLGFCPGGARPFKGMPPKCALSKRPFPAGCTSDKQCPKGKKCCPTYCGGRRCVTALKFPPP